MTPWSNIIEIGTAFSIVGGVLLWLGSRVFVTKKDCKEEKHLCQERLCRKLDELARRRDEDKAEAIREREKLERMVTAQFTEVRQFMGRIEGVLETLRRP